MKGEFIINRFNHFSINELEIIKKAIITSIEKDQFQGEKLGQIKRLWAELDAELGEKRIQQYQSQSKSE